MSSDSSAFRYWQAIQAKWAVYSNQSKSESPVYFHNNARGSVAACMNCVLETVPQGTPSYGQLVSIVAGPDGRGPGMEKGFFYHISSPADAATGETEKFYVVKRRGHVLLLKGLLTERLITARVYAACTSGSP